MGPPCRTDTYVAATRGGKRSIAAAAAVAAAKCTGIFAHRVDPRRALCPFDLRGLCHDPKCPWQSREAGGRAGRSNLYSVQGPIVYSTPPQLRALTRLF